MFKFIETSKNNSKVIKKILNKERRNKLSNPKTFFFAFYKEIQSIKKNILKKIDNIKSEGKRIHCYGASTKGNVLLQYFGLNHKKIDFVAERNKNKYGLFTPGTKIKIISEKKSRSLKPEYYLVLPWHFKKEILLREKKNY